MMKISTAWFGLIFFSLSTPLYAQTAESLIQLPQNPSLFARLQKNLSLDPKIELTLKKQYLKAYYLPWTQVISSQDKKDLQGFEKEMLHNLMAAPGFNENTEPHHQSWVQSIAWNINIAHFPSQNNLAIAVNNTDLRVLPTRIPVFGNPKKAGEGFPFDQLQVSMATQGTPALILQTTQDGAWSFVIIPGNASGWISTKDLAWVTPRFIRKWQHYSIVTPILAGVPVRNHRHNLYYFSTRLGEIYPLISTKQSSAVIATALKNVDGFAVIEKGYLPKSAVKPWPILASTLEIAALAEKFMGEPYGWGNLYQYRDCSSTTRDLFAPFGIFLARHSDEQAKTGKTIILAGKTRAQKAQILATQGIPFFTLLSLDDHVMLYIGQWQNQLIAFHSPWGIHTHFQQQNGRIIIGQTVITPLTLGQNLPDVQKTWLDQIGSFTYLVPPEKLTQNQLPS